MIVKQTPAQIAAQIRNEFPYFADPSKHAKLAGSSALNKPKANDKFAKDWKVTDEAQQYENSKRFNDFCQIGALLTDESRCLEHLKALDEEMAKELLNSKITGNPSAIQRIPLEGRDTASPDKPSQESKEKLAKADWEKIRTTKFHKLLHRVLFRFEQTWGFNVDEFGVPTLTGFIYPTVFNDELIKKARHFKDPGAEVIHGEYTHRLQWFIICREHATGGPYRLNGTPKKRFCNMAEYSTWFDKRPEYLKENAPEAAMVTMWDFLVDCVRSWSPQKDSNFLSDSFRSPEYLNLYLTDSTRETQKTYPLPVLTAYLTERFNKRTWQVAKYGEKQLDIYLDNLKSKWNISEEKYEQFVGVMNPWAGAYGRVVPRQKPNA